MGSTVSHLTQYDIEEVQFACDNKCASSARGRAGRISKLATGSIWRHARYFAPPRVHARLAEVAAALGPPCVLRT